MQVTEQKFCEDWVKRMGEFTPLTTASVVQYLNFVSQQNAQMSAEELRQIAENIAANSMAQPKTDWGDGYRQACTDIAGGLRLRANAKFMSKE